MFTALAALLAFGTIWFWILSFAVFCVITALVENDEGVWATVVFVGSVLSLNFLSKLPIIDTIKQNPVRVLVCVGVYFLAGMAWSIVKWYFYVHNQIVKYNDWKVSFLKDNNVTAMTPQLAAQFLKWLRDSYDARNAGITGQTPEARQHKGSLTRRATYWPFSIIGTLLNDVVRRAWEYIYEMLQTTYQRIAESIFHSASEDLKLAAQYKAKNADPDDQLEPRGIRRR